MRMLSENQNEVPEAWSSLPTTVKTFVMVGNSTHLFFSLHMDKHICDQIYMYIILSYIFYFFIEL